MGTSEATGRVTLCSCEALIRVHVFQAKTYLREIDPLLPIGSVNISSVQAVEVETRAL